MKEKSQLEWIESREVYAASPRDRKWRCPLIREAVIHSRHIHYDSYHIEHRGEAIPASERYRCAYIPNSLPFADLERGKIACEELAAARAVELLTALGIPAPLPQAAPPRKGNNYGETLAVWNRIHSMIAINLRVGDVMRLMNAPTGSETRYRAILRHLCAQGKLFRPYIGVYQVDPQQGGLR